MQTNTQPWNEQWEGRPVWLAWAGVVQWQEATAAVIHYNSLHVFLLWFISFIWGIFKKKKRLKLCMNLQSLLLVLMLGVQPEGLDSTEKFCPVSVWQTLALCWQWEKSDLSGTQISPPQWFGSLGDGCSCWPAPLQHPEVTAFTLEG